MRSHLAVALLLAVSLVASAAYAAPDKANVTFESLSASGVVGEATLDPTPAGEVRIHASLKGLVPNAQYQAVVYESSLTCGVGTPSFQLIEFSANPAGIATWNIKVARDLSIMQSIGILQVSTDQAVACGAVEQ